MIHYSVKQPQSLAQLPRYVSSSGVRDVTFGEDRSPVRTAGGPHSLATMRTLAIGALRLAGDDNITQAPRWVARDPHRALSLLGQ
ncbi:MAG TPA: hypothetical protein VNF24_08130 [Candidatus Acidoferrales bacterium]|nr:hypothetical protein [Candidatus Acidoferrales bacterium]